MPVSKKRKSSKKPVRIGSKNSLLPMPRPEADAMCLRCRLALDVVRQGQASLQEATVLAQAVLLTSFLTEAGHGTLDLSVVREVERHVLAIIDSGTTTGVWEFDAPIVESLTAIVNEHDRQLREVRFGAVATAIERLDRMVATANSSTDATTRIKSYSLDPEQ